jgi:hypothetical protein
MSRYYDVDPRDPEAPQVLDVWNGMRPGDSVRYIGDIPLEGPLVVDEIVSFGSYVNIILNEGEYEVDAVNLELDT